ncbi:MAG TPA: LCP family protein [Solirubrobacterales bacterium]|nr:LCP family protein [Solirubrobacterales bacterium]
MSPQGDDRPPKRPKGSGGGGKPDEPKKPGASGAKGKPEKGKKPEYTVYGSGGRGGRSGQKRAASQQKKPAGKSGSGGRGEKPPYTVYRARPSLRDRLRKPNLESIRRESGGGGGIRGFFGRLTGGKRPWLRWILIFAVGWLLLSFITFAISAQIQKGKLPQSAKDALKGGPAVLAGQNILILGGDRRGKTQHNASGSEGQGPPRADTIMVLHASLTSFRKLSIPRDSYAAIPNCGSQKINASLACNTRSPNGNPAETIKTVENFLGIDINHIIIVDFDGFASFINTLGGVTIHVPGNPNRSGAVVCGDVDGGKKQGGVSLKLPPGDITLQGDKALAYARIRHNNCNPSEDDRDRAARQQAVLNAIKGRLTSITRFPYNFLKGPLIGWNAPRAFISDMGGFTLPQVAIAAILGGNGDTNVLGSDKAGVGVGPGGSLEIPQGACDEAVKKLLGGDPPRRPACSP